MSYNLQIIYLVHISNNNYNKSSVHFNNLLPEGSKRRTDNRIDSNDDVEYFKLLWWVMLGHILFKVEWL